MPPRATTRRCKDCAAEGVLTTRPAPHPGPRCVTHHRVRKKVTRDTSWERRLIDTYGITAAEYWAIYEYQGRCCYICRRATGTGRKRLSVDHDHKTGFVRGLVCSPCNRDVLGHARDEIEFFERAISYLSNPPASEVIGWRRVPLGGAPVKDDTYGLVGVRRTTTVGGEPEALTA